MRPVSRTIVVGLLIICSLFSMVSLASAEGFVLPPNMIVQKLEAKIQGYLHDPSYTAMASQNGYFRDGLALLQKYHTLATPKLIDVNGKPVKYLVPIVFDEKTLAGFIHVDPVDGDVLGWPSWDSSGKPLYRVSREEWEGRTDAASWTAAISELIPNNLLVSPGLRVNPYTETGWRVVDHGLDEMPSKNQEDRKEWIDEINSLHQPRPRWTTFGTRWRQPALKCLSFAAATCADWWTMEYGRMLGSYTNVVNGALEYGHNPRAVETIFYVRHRLDPLKYFTVPFYPDPVTHENVPFSLPGYADALTRPMRGTLPDPALPSAFSYTYPKNVFCMDKPPVTIFRFERGKSEKLKTALARHGIVYAQVDSGIPVIGPLSGIHAVAIVGYRDTATGTIFLYRESFGNFSAEYQEDMGGGPKYRGLGIDGFNQAYAFPHGLEADVLSRSGTAATVKVSNGGGIPIDCDLPGSRALSLVSGKTLSMTRGSRKGELIIDLSQDGARADRIKLILPRRYYYQADGKPAEIDLVLSQPKPKLTPTDTELMGIVTDALDRLEAFVATLEVRKASYAFYSIFARWRISTQLSEVMQHRITLNAAWDAFEKEPTPAGRGKLVVMMTGAIGDYEKKLRAYEADLDKKVKSEKDAIKRERLQVELMEVRGFIASIGQLRSRLDAIVARLPVGALGSNDPRGKVVAAARSSAASGTPAVTASANESGKEIGETDAGGLPVGTGNRKLSATSGQAFADYKAAYQEYQTALSAGDQAAMQAAMLKYREAYDRYQSSLVLEGD